MAESAENPITPTHFLGSTPDAGPGSDVGTFDPATARTLLNVAAGATANATDAALRDRSTHTGSQAESTITGLVADLAGKAAASHTHVEADVTGLTAALALKAPLASPALTGTPTVPTAAPGTNTTQAANTAFVEQRAQAIAAGLSFKNSVRVATTTNGTLATAFQNGATVDGVVLATGNRILIMNQSAQAENGFYVVPASGAPTRSTDADTWAEIVSAFCFVEEGTSHADTSWVCNVNVGGTINTTAITFVQFAGSSSAIADGDKGDITVSGSGLVWTVDPDAITTAKILNANVTAGKLASDAVTTVKILDSNVTDTKLAANAVTTAKILDSNVTTAKIADGSVTTVKILDANVTTAKVAADAIDNTKLANMTAGTYKMRVTGSTGDPEDATATQATAGLNAFTSALKGLAPASGGGTSNFLRADGTWAAAGGGSGGVTGTPNSNSSSGAPAVALSTTEVQVGTITITPSSTTAQIMVLANVELTKDTGTTVRSCTLRVRRGTTNGSTQVGGDLVCTSSGVASSAYNGSLAGGFDSPASVASQTYSVRAVMGAGASTAARYNLVAMEVGSGGFDIAGLAEETTPDATADFLLLRDTSGSDNNKLLPDNLRVSMGAGATGFSQRTLKSKLGDYVNVLDFGAIADWNGTTGTNNTNAFANAFATGKPVWFPKSSGTGMYWMGNIGAFEIKFGNPASRQYLSDGARLVVTTTVSTRPYLFYFSTGSNLVFDGLQFQDTGFDIGIDFKGANCITFGCDDTDVTNVYVNCSFLNVVTPLQSLAGNNNLRNLRGQIFCVNTYYGALLESGINVDLLIYHEGGRRGYFCASGQGSATGKVINHNIQLHVRNRGTANGCVMIKNYGGIIDGVYVKVTVEGTNDGDSSIVRFEKENAANPAARNIHVDITNVDDPTFLTDIHFNAVTGSGVHSWENVKITGRSKFNVEATASYLHDIIIDVDARTLRDQLELASIGPAWALRCGNKVYKSRRNVQLSTNSISFDLRPLQPASLNAHYKVCIFACNNRTVLTTSSVVAYEEHSVLAMLTATPVATLNIQTQMIAQFDTTDPGCIISESGTSLLITFPAYTGANGDAIVSIEPYA